MKKRNNDMKRHCRGTKKIIWMKWKLLTFTKSVTRRLARFHSLKKHEGHPNQMNLKKHQSHPNQMNLKKYQGQAMEKKVKKTSQPKKAPKSPEFIDSSEEEEEGPLKDDKGKKCLLC